MATRSALNKIIGSQHNDRTIKTARVPYREEEPRTSRMPDNKRKQMEAILNKERNKEKRERVGLVLTKKLSAKYGAKYESLISFFVEEFFSTHDEIDSHDLDTLEKEIRNAIRSKIDAAEQQRNAPTVQNERKEASEQSSNPAEDLPSRPPSGKEWAWIQAYQVVLDEEQINREKEIARQKKMAFKAALDEHVNYSKKVMRNQNDDDVRYAQRVMADVEKFHEEEQKKYEEKKKHHHEELIMRKAQIQEQRQRIIDEKSELRKLEEMNLKLAREQLEKESEKQRMIRLREKEAHMKIKKENEINKQLRLEEKMREAELDHKLMVQYAAKLDREAAEREEAFNKRMAEMEKHAAKFENEGAGKALKEDQIRFEKMLLKEQQKKEEEDFRKEQQKEEDKRRRLQEQLTENQRQLDKKREDLLREHERDAELRERFMQEVDEFKRHEEQKRLKKLQDQDNYRRKLDLQVDELKRVDRNLVGITPVEKKLNLSTLKEITGDTKTLSKVMHQMRISNANAAKK